METLDSTPDVTPLQAAGDPERFRILRRLLRGPATQKELAIELEINSGTLSKHIKKLSGAGIIGQQRPGHAPYELRFRDSVAILLQANANLVGERDKAKAAAADLQSRELNEAILRPTSAGSDSETA